MAGEDVFRDREVGKDLHRGDTKSLRVLGGTDTDRAAVDQDLAGIWLLDAGHDLDQRRFAGAVLTEEGVKLAAKER